MVDSQQWRPILFSCPKTGSKVQALLAEEAIRASVPPRGAGSQYEAVSCLACSGVHFVDPRDGKVLGAPPNGG